LLPISPSHAWGVAWRCPTAGLIRLPCFVRIFLWLFDLEWLRPHYCAGCSRIRFHPILAACRLSVSHKLWENLLITRLV
jgi:hypothetical protein